VSAVESSSLRRWLGRRLRSKFTGRPHPRAADDREAEHIPGCNMAYRKSALLEIGWLRLNVFRVAGDDVDVCWSLQRRNWKLGFSPAAVVWHHRRNSGSNVFEAAAGLRPSRSSAREKVAREIQLNWSRLLGRQSIWQRFLHGSSARRPNIPRNLGDCPFPASL